MIIFIIPGFCSHNPNRKFEVIKKYLPNEFVVGLSYCSNDPNEIEKYFKRSIDNAIEYYDTDKILFLGSSLGAFWTKYLANTYNSKSILINPALDPLNSLKNHIGLNKNNYTNDIMPLTCNMVNDYMSYYSNHNKGHDLILLDKGDELFDYSITYNMAKTWLNTKTILFEDGNHSFIHIKESLPYIEEFINEKI